MSSRNEMDDLMHYDVEFVFDQMQFGGGLVRSRQRAETQEFMQYLIDLGWKPNFLKTQFKHLNDKLLNTWHFRVFAKKYFELLIDKEGFQSSIYESLMLIGLRRDVAAHLETVLFPLLGTSYTDTQVLHSGIYYLLGRCNPVSTAITTHCIQPRMLNKWVVHNQATMRNPVLICNVPFNCSNPQACLAFESGLSKLQIVDSSSLFFHTTSWGGALSMFKRINRLVGRTCLDFGLLPGFYMSETSKECLDWGKANQLIWSQEVAILIFAVPTNLPSELKYKQLVGSEWTFVTKVSRECKDDSNEIEQIHNYDLLYGNMVSNPKPVKLGQELPRAHNPSKKQLVARTDAAEQFIHSCLVGCVFFQKHVPPPSPVKKMNIQPML